MSAARTSSERQRIARAKESDEELHARAQAGDRGAARRLRNRNSAAQSRKRSREYTLALEDSVHALRERCVRAGRAPEGAHAAPPRGTSFAPRHLAQGD
jgi:Basic region leucine zipper